MFALRPLVGTGTETKFLVRGLWRVRDMYWLQAPGMRKISVRTIQQYVSDRRVRVWFAFVHSYTDGSSLAHAEAEFFSTPRKAAGAVVAIAGAARREE